MAANEKFSDLGLDDLESDTLLRDDDNTLSEDDDAVNLDAFDLNSDLDLNLDDVMSDEESTADDLDNLDNLDYSEAAGFDETAPDEENAPRVESDMGDGDVVDYPDAIDGGSDTADLSDELSDDDLDLSLEAGLDDVSEVSAEISDEDVANYDDSDYADDGLNAAAEEIADSDDDEDDDDDEAYGVDLKTGPVTIAFTQVIEPEEPAASEEPAYDGLVDDGGLDFENDLSEDLLSSYDEELSDEPADEEPADEDNGIIDDDGQEEAFDEEASFGQDSEEEFDIASDDDLEFDVEEDDALNGIDIDDVLEQHSEDNGDVLNIPMPKEEELTVDEEQNAYLSGEFSDDDLNLDSLASNEEYNDEEVTENVAESEPSEYDALLAEEADLSDLPADSITLGLDEPTDEPDLDALPETLDAEANIELGLVDSTDSNLISDDELSALEEQMPDPDEQDEDAEPATEAMLAEEVIVEPSKAVGSLDDDEKISLDGDEDLEFDAEESAADMSEEDSAAEPDLADDLPVSLDEDESAAAEQDADELPQDFDEITDDGSVTDIDPDAIPAAQTFGEDDEDETIGLSGEELDNILIDTETEQADEDEGFIDEELTQMPSDEELAESINIPDDPGFENDDEFMSDEELAASVTLPGESEHTQADNDIMTNGDLDLYENVDEDGSIPESTDDDTQVTEGNAIIVPAAEDTLSEEPFADEEAEPAGADETAAEETEEESETIDLASFEADLEPSEQAEYSEDGVLDDETIAEDAEDDKIDLSEEETNEIYDSLQNEAAQPSGDNDEELKSDIRNVLTCLDSLLGSLPEEKIKQFAESKEFEAYRRLFEQLDIKH